MTLSKGDIVGKLITSYGIPAGDTPYKESIAPPGGGNESHVFFRVVDPGFGRVQDGAPVMVGVVLEVLPDDFYAGIDNLSGDEKTAVDTDPDVADLTDAVGRARTNAGKLRETVETRP